MRRAVIFTAAALLFLAFPVRGDDIPEDVFPDGSKLITEQEAGALQIAPSAAEIPSESSLSDDTPVEPVLEMTPYEYLLIMEEEETDITELREYCKDEPAEIPIDFASLQAANPELYAWVRVDGTPIDYAVAQHDGEEGYYLHRNIYGQEEFAGCIFTEFPNKKNFTSLVTVMYGHNMRNGSMFHGLHSFRDRAFFDAHDTIEVYTPEAFYTYRIFACYIFEDTNLLTFDVHTPELYEAYLTDIRENYAKEGNLRDDVELDSESRILTLSTCVGSMPENRCLVQAVLVKIQPAR